MRSAIAPLMLVSSMSLTSVVNAAAAARWTHRYLRCSAPGRCPPSLRRSRASRRCALSRRSRVSTGCAARPVSTRRESSCCPSCGATATPGRRRSCCRRTAGSSTARSGPGRPGRPVSQSCGRSTPRGRDASAWRVGTRRRWDWRRTASRPRGERGTGRRRRRNRGERLRRQGDHRTDRADVVATRARWPGSRWGSSAPRAS